MRRDCVMYECMWTVIEKTGRPCIFPHAVVELCLATDGQIHAFHIQPGIKTTIFLEERLLKRHVVSIKAFALAKESCLVTPGGLFEFVFEPLWLWSVVHGKDWAPHAPR